MASPSGRACEVTTKRRRLWTTSTMRATVSWSVPLWIIGEGANRARIVGRLGSGALALPLRFFFMEIAEDLLDPVLVGDRFIEMELQFGHAAELQPASDLTPEERRRAFERLLGLAPRLRIAHRRVIDARELQVRRDLDPGQGDEPDARIVDDPAREQQAQLLQDLVADAIGTECSHL